MEAAACGILLDRDDPRLGAFLDARNPKKELSSSLDSLLILPIQVVLKPSV